MKRETYAFLIAVAVVALIIMNTNTAIGNGKIEAALAEANSMHIDTSRRANVQVTQQVEKNIQTVINERTEAVTKLQLALTGKISKNFGENTENIDANDVLILQKYLAAHGFLKEKYVTGEFGPITKQALKDFQVANNITPATGFVGDMTREKINSGN